MLTKDFLPGVPLIESPFFAQDVKALPEGYQLLAKQINEKGYVVFDFPDPELGSKIEAIKTHLCARLGWSDPASNASQRAQDAWTFDDDVRSIACNEKVIDLLSALYGRPAVPFQTLNFPIGTQQSIHSDHFHFNSIPDRFMCGVWVAFEDMDEDNGPLFYYPGTHKWPSFANEHIGVSHKRQPYNISEEKFTRLYEELVARSGAQRELFLARKGQALIWAANLLHGGSPQKDLNRSRWSQVTHYFFEGCGYTTPLLDDTYHGYINFREIIDIRDDSVVPNIVSGEPVTAIEYAQRERLARMEEKMSASPFRKHASIPADFDPRGYLSKNRDILAKEFDPYEHYVAYGKNEKRRW